MDSNPILSGDDKKSQQHEKLQSKWEEPFKDMSISTHGAVIHQNDEGTLFKVNGHRLKIFLEPEKPHEDLDEVNFIIFP